MSGTQTRAPAQPTLARPSASQGWAALGVLGGAAALTWLRDPHVPGNLGTCPSLLLFGVYCPGCGSLRAIHDLTHGDLGAAFGHNVLVVPALLFVVGWAVWAIRPRWLAGGLDQIAQWWRQSALARLPLVWGLVVVLVAFTVLRNLPGSALAP